MRTVRLLVAVAVPAIVTFPATPAGAQQDVRYETVTKSEFAGAMGTIMNMAARMGGGSNERVEVTSIKGARMRTDSDKTSMIVDLEAGRFISLDHSARTYQMMTFEEMKQMMERATSEMRASAQQQQSEASRRDPNEPESTVNFKFRVDRTRERERISGYDAARAFLTVEAEGEYKPEGSDESQPAGTLVMFTDIWSSTSVPALSARQAFERANAQAMANASASMAQGLAGVFARDPKLRGGMEKMTAEAAKIEGMPLRTITRMVLVPAGKQFDRDAAIAPKPQASQAQPSLRSALGGLMRGRGGQSQQPPASAEEQTQVTFMTVTEEVRNITVSSLDANLFEPPANYRRVEMNR